MGEKPRKPVVAVLPNSFCYDERRFRMDMRKNVHTHALAADEAVFPIRVESMGAAENYAFGKECFSEHLFQVGLGLPADFVGSLAQISASDKQDLISCDWFVDFNLSDGVLCHGHPSIMRWLNEDNNALDLCECNARKLRFKGMIRRSSCFRE